MLVLPDIVVCLRLLVDPVALEAAVWHVFLVDAPADALSLQEIDDGLDAGANAREAVAGYAVGVCSHSGDVVGLRKSVNTAADDVQMRAYLRRMRDGIVVGEQDALACQVGQAGWDVSESRVRPESQEGDDIRSPTAKA